MIKESSLESLSMELKDQNLLFVYKNRTVHKSIPLFETFYIPSNFTTDGQWHSLRIQEKDKKLHLILNEGENSINFTLLNSFSIKQFALDHASKIIIGKFSENYHSFKVIF